MQCATEMHEATIVEGGAVLDLGRSDVLQFCGEHRRGNFRILDGEGAAESAATVEVCERDELKAANLAEQAQSVGRRREGRAGRGNWRDK